MRLTALMLFALLAAGQAQAYDVTIGSGASSQGTWVGNTWTPSAAGSTVAASEVATRLLSGPVTVLSTDADPLTVQAELSWASNTLSLQAGGDLRVRQPLQGSGSAGLALRFGQNAPAAGNAADYRLDASITLGSGGSFSTQQGSDGAVLGYALINTLSDLQAVVPGQRYALATDLDASATASWNGNQGFVPLVGFNNVFAGLGHTLQGLSITRPSNSLTGLFADLDGATVRDLRLSQARIQGAARVGILAGLIMNSSVSQVHVTGTVQAFQEAGGLAGWFSQSSLSQASSTATVSSATNDAGGLIGYLIYDASLSDAYACGTVSAGGPRAGGLIGRVSNSSLSLSRVYASGAVSAGSSSGGLIGGSDSNTFNVVAAFWDQDSSLQSSSADNVGVPLNSVQARNSSSYPGYDFGSTWIQLPGMRPMLRGEYARAIYTPHALQLMLTQPQAAYTLGADLELGPAFTPNLLGAYAEVWDANGFMPVGSSGTPFTGSLDGQGHTVSGLVIRRASANYTGLFGYVSGGVIHDLTLTGGSVAGNDDVGALVGYLLGGSVSRASASVDVTASSSGEANAGGLVGAADGATLIDTHASGSVSGAGYQVGGLVGFLLHGGTISRSYATGSVTGTSTLAGNGYVGGLVGANGYTGDGGTISLSFASGSVSAGSGPVGGLVGHNEGTISDAYAGGSVTGLATATHIGGFAGINFVNGQITRAYASGAVSGGSVRGGFAAWNNNPAAALSESYWDTASTGQSAGLAGGSASGLAGRSTAQMQALATYAGWDMNDSGGSASTWRIYEGLSYPWLRGFFSAPLTATALSGSRTYDGSRTGLGVGYSPTPDSRLLGTAASLADGPAIGSHTVSVQDIYSGQLGYDIARVDGTLDITALDTSHLPLPRGGTAAVTVSDDMGNGCQFVSARFVAPNTIAETLPAGMTLASDLFDFVLDGCAPHATASLSIQYPGSLNGATQYWKHGPTSNNTTPHWYHHATASLGASTVTLQVTNGADGDDDLDGNNSRIVDAGGPAALVAGEPTPVPTLAPWGLALLAGLLGTLASWPRRRPRD